MVKIKFKTDNAAFEGEGQNIEIARILRKLADKIETSNQLTYCPLMDINGNKVGEFEIA